MKTVILGMVLACTGSATTTAAHPDRAELLSQLARRADVQQQMILREPTGLFQCGIRMLGRDGRTLYAWLSCGDYRTGPHAAVLGASSMPAVIRLDRHGDVARVRFPRQQALRADIERMFPPHPQDRAINGNIRTRPSAASLLERAEHTAPRPPGAR